VFFFEQFFPILRLAAAASCRLATLPELYSLKSQKRRLAAAASRKNGVKMEFRQSVVVIMWRAAARLTFAAARPGGHQRDANQCGACARPKDECSLVSGGVGTTKAVMCNLYGKTHQCAIFLSFLGFLDPT